MILRKYYDFLFLNEAKVDNISEGDFVVCDKNFAGYKDLAGKLAKVLSIDKDYYTPDGYLHKGDLKLEIQKPADLENYNVPYQKSDGQPIDTITISRNQGAYLTKISPEEVRDYLKGNLIPFERSEDIDKILDNIDLKIKRKYVELYCVDVDKEKNDSITYLPANKRNRSEGDPYKSRMREPMKVGKFLKKINPDLSEKQVDDLIVKFKVAWEKVVKNVGEEVEVVTGEDIRYWYLGSRYGKSPEGRFHADNNNQGELGSSCMQYPRSQHRFDIYCENPDKCAMAIIVKDKKLMARAIIWKLDDGKVYMDRIYAVDQPTEQKVRDYCKKKQMEGPWVRDKNGVKRVTLIDKDYGDSDNNPFMDTFKYFNKSKHQLLTPDAYEKDYGHPDRFQSYYYTGND